MKTLVISNQSMNKERDTKVFNKNIKRIASVAKNEGALIVISEQLFTEEIKSTFSKIEYRVVPPMATEPDFVKTVLDNLDHDFLIIDLLKNEIVPYNFGVFMKQKKNDNWSTISPSLANTAYPFIQNLLIDKKSEKTVQQIIKQFLKMAQKTDLSIEITGNPYCCYFSIEKYREIEFDWSLKTMKEIIFNYFYRTIEYDCLNYVSLRSSLYRYIPQNGETIEFLEDVQQEQKITLEKYTTGYLSYEPIFHQQEEKILTQRKQTLQKVAFRGKRTDKSVLFIAPNDIFINGLNAHLTDLYMNIKDTNFYILMPSFSFNEAKFFELVHYFNGVELSRQRLPYFDSMHITNVSSHEYQRMIESIIKSYKITTIHVHIMALGHTLDAPSVGRKLGVTVILSLHDLYYLSGDFTQRNTDIAYRADILLEKYNIQQAEVFYKRWHTAVQNMFNAVDELIVFSKSTQNIYEKWYDLPTQTSIIPHGYNYKKKFSVGVPFQKEDKKLRAVFFGRVEEEKGSNLLWELAKNNKNCELHVFGTVADPRFSKRILPQNIKVYGKYKKENLPFLLKKVKPHFVYLPSVWDETFAFTLTEAYLYGVYPVVSAKGALAERVHESGIGIVVENGNIAEALTEIKKLDWNENAKKMRSMELTKIKDMVEIYATLYNVFSAEKISSSIFFSDIKKNDASLWSEMIEKNLDSFILLQEKMTNNTFIKNRIENSRSWKLLEQYRKWRKKMLGAKKQ